MINAVIEDCEEKDYTTIAEAMKLSKELLLYIEDVINTIPELANIISNAILYYAIYPLIMARFMEKEDIAYLKIDIALAMLNQIVNTIKYKPLLEAIVKPLVSSFIPLECLNAIEEFPEYVKGYSRAWKPFSYKNDIDCSIHT